MKEALLKATVSGVEFADVHARKPFRPSTTWFEPVIAGPFVEMDPTTRAGPPFEGSVPPDQCGRDDLLGANLLTEVFVKVSSLSGSADFGWTTVCGGTTRTPTPCRVVLISQKVRHVLSDLGASGYKLQVVRVAS